MTKKIIDSANKKIEELRNLVADLVQNFHTNPENKNFLQIFELHKKLT